MILRHFNIKNLPVLAHKHKRLLVLLALYLCLTTGYNVILPIINSDDHDEAAHFRYIHFIAENHRLPENMEERLAVGHRAKSGYPPFYQGITALLVSWIEADNLTFLEKPSISVREVMAGQNWLFQTTGLNLPYQNAVLFWHLGRFFSSLLGAGAAIMTYAIALELFPGKKAIALLAAAMLAFMPRFVFMSATLSDDNMLAFLMSIYLFFMVRIIKGDNCWRNYVVVGIMLGLAITTKFSVALVPFVSVLMLIILARQQRSPWQTLVKRIAVVAVTAILVSSWWFIFVIRNFNEIETKGLVRGVFSAVVPEVAGGVSGDELLSTIQGGAIAVENERQDSFIAWLIFFTKAFWEARLVILPDIFLVFNRGFWIIVAVIGFISLGIYQTWRRGNEFQRTWIIFFILHLLSLLPFMLIRHYFKGNVYETAQGRHALMPSAAAVGILLMVGWGYWSRTRTFFWLRPILPTLLVFWSITQLYFIYYLFPHPLPISLDETTQSRIPAPEVTLGQLYFDTIELVGYTTHFLPEQSTLKVDLVWKAHKQAADDYITEIQLLDQTGQPVSGWIGHPADGVYPTRAWQEGNMIFHSVDLPLYNLPPGNYNLEAYLLDGYERPVERVTDRLFSVPIAIKNPVKYPSGFKSLVVNTDSVPVTVYYQIWPFDFFDLTNPLYRYRSTIPIAWDTRSALDAGQSLRLGMVAPDGQIFTPLNQGGNLDSFIIDPRWPSGWYHLQIEILRGDEVLGVAQSPTLLRVENVERQFTPQPNEYQVDANFYNVVRLLGYDLSTTRPEPGEVLTVSLQWEALRVVNSYFRIFCSLYDVKNKVWLANDYDSPHRTIVRVPGEISSDQYELWIDPQIPDGVYTVHAGFFLPDSTGGQLRFPLIVDDQVTDIDYVTLGPIKIGGPPPGVLAENVDPQYPSANRLGDVLELKGYDLTYAFEDREIHLTLYWKSIGVAGINYTTFVHLQNDSGEVVAQADSQPAAGAYPTSLWDVGEVVRDEVVIPLPADLSAGEYRLFTGMYDLATGERLTVPNSLDNAVLLTTYKSSSLK